MNNPIIRFEVQAMQHTVMIALSEYAARMDSDIQMALKEALTPEKVFTTIKKAADEEIKRAIESEIRAFYSHGVGLQVIRKAVTATLNEQAKIMKDFR